MMCHYTKDQQQQTKSLTLSLSPHMSEHIHVPRRVFCFGLTVKFGLISSRAASPSSHRSSKLFRNLWSRNQGREVELCKNALSGGLEKTYPRRKRIFELSLLTSKVLNSSSLLLSPVAWCCHLIMIIVSTFLTIHHYHHDDHLQSRPPLLVGLATPLLVNSTPAKTRTCQWPPSSLLSWS